ncbi:MAG: nickel pincer cofactor biosynthesis protein LarC [Pyrinomonadaceae bacterium]
MRTLYFDCFAGASGDMILGALIGVGVDQRELLEQLARLNLANYRIDFEIVDRSGISATYARVRTEREHHHRHLSDILKIINESDLGSSVKERAGRIFTRLAEAEARVHNMDANRVHFHEVGAIDAIVDVVGACIGFELLGVDRFMASPLHVGSGMVEMAHGRFPVPPPAVVELLRDAPTYASNIQGELLTPTGAAIISTVCEEFGPMPLMRVERTGYGAGTREYERFPNVLRLMLGHEEVGRQQQGRNVETLLMIETNIDDMSPQQLGYVMDRAFDLKALDCYFTPVHMKKNRPGVLVSILCARDNREDLCQLLLDETTTLGVRYYEVERRALEREYERVETRYGAIDIKIGKANDRVVKAMPEYEQCREAAERSGQPLRVVEEAARNAYARRRSPGSGEES